MMNGKMTQDILIEQALIHCVEQAALSAAPWIGKGQEKEADAAAVEAMRHALDHAPFKGIVVIGEGERDEAPRLYVGEEVGTLTSHHIMDIAVDPLEGTTLTATARPGAITVMALAPQNTLLKAPDVYMNKLAVGPDIPKNSVSLRLSIHENLKILSKIKNKAPHHLMVCVLDRPRHQDIIEEIRAFGAQIMLIQDGDVWAAMATCYPHTGIDIYLGSGGAPEGVLAASALKCLGGYFEGQLMFNKPEEYERGQACGIEDFTKIYTRDDLVKADVLFAATGVTSGPLLEGVSIHHNKIELETFVLKSNPRSEKRIHTLSWL
jgi:fructose-1,6-bisphosphatase II / sedoheptulose-1,7-bisphosphatase